MALTVSAAVSGSKFIIGNKDTATLTITFDSSYPAGGEPLTAATLGFKSIVAVIPHGVFRSTDGTAAVSVSYDYANATLFAHWSAGGAIAMPEVTGGTNLAVYSGRVTVIGTN